DKATMEVPAPFAGKVTSVIGEPGTRLKVGQVILSYQSDGTKMEAPAAAPHRATPAVTAVSVAAPANGPTGGTATAVAAPSVRHLARRLGIDLARIRGSGPAGRILLDDLAPLIAKQDGPVKARPAEPTADYGRPGTRV